MEDNQSTKKEWKILAIWVFAMFFGIAYLFGFGSADVETANPPTIITYQGKLLKSSQSVTTTQTMSFLIFDAATSGNLLYTASGTLVATSTLQIDVSNGIFAVDMGGTGTNSFDSGMFANTTTLYLEIWVHEGTAETKLTPRKQLTAAPFAYNSTYLLGKTAAVTSTSSYIPFASTTGMFEFAGDPQSSHVGSGSVYINPMAADADETLFGIALNGSERYRIDEDGDAVNFGNLTVSTTFYTDVTNGRVGINSSTPTYALSVNGDAYITGTTTIADKFEVKGKVLDPIHAGKINDHTGGALLNGVFDIVTQGDYAYLAVKEDESIAVLDISVPSTPTLVSQVFDGVGIPRYLGHVEDIDIQGNYLYAIDRDLDTLEILDISDPTNLAHVGSIADGGASAPFMDGAERVDVVGNYAYVGCTGSLEIIDVSDPHNPKHAGYLLDGGGSAPYIAETKHIVVSGNYAYILDNASDALEIVDISDPGNPMHAGSLVDGVGVAPYLNGPYEIAISGRYAYITSLSSNALEIVDISNPKVPAHAGSLLSVGNVLLSGPRNIVVAGNYIYITFSSSKALEILDISNPISPVFVSSIVHGDGGAALDWAESLAISGNYAYVGTYFNENAFEVINITGAVISNTEIGNARITNLSVDNGVTFNDAVSIKGGLSVGSSGLLVSGNFGMSSATSTATATNTLSFSHKALFKSHSNAANGPAFIFDTSNTFTTANSSTYVMSVRNNTMPLFAVAGNGDVITSGTLWATSATVGAPGTPGDLAERVDIHPTESVSAGDVLIVDIESPDRYRKSRQSHEPGVAGVVSTKPTIVVGNGRTAHTASMAIVGRVPVKVTNENGPVEAGDLLVTANKPGYAMKYDSLQDDGSKAVAIVGIALENLVGEEGSVASLIRSGWINSRHATITTMQQELVAIAESEGVDLNLESEELTVTIDGATGNLINISENLDMNGYYIVNVAGLFGTDEKWQIDEQGRFVTKVTTSEGEKSLYALQSQETEYVFSGTGTLINGETKIDFDQVTQEIIDGEKPLKINVTLTSEANGVYVSFKDKTGFTVRELGNGTSNATFDWMVIATRMLQENNVEEIQEQDEPPVVESIPPEDTTEEEIIEEIPPGEEVVDEPAPEESVEESPTEVPQEEPAPEPEIIVETPVEPVQEAPPVETSPTDPTPIE